MFDGIRRRWAEARGDVVLKEIHDILSRYYRMHTSDQLLVEQAFSSIRDIQDELGPLCNWSAKMRQSVAGKLRAKARKMLSNRGTGAAQEMARMSSHGVALLALHIEAVGLPGKRAQDAIMLINGWISDTSQTP